MVKALHSAGIEVILDVVYNHGPRDTLLILLNAHYAEVPFALPSVSPSTAWVRILDTMAVHVDDRRFAGDTTYPLQGRTLALFALGSGRRERPAEAATS